MPVCLRGATFLKVDGTKPATYHCQASKHSPLPISMNALKTYLSFPYVISPNYVFSLAA